MRAALVVMMVGSTTMAADQDRPRPVDAAAAKGRYFGVKVTGTDPYAFEDLTLVLDGSSTGTLSWVLRGNGEERSRLELRVVGIRIENGSLTARVEGRRPPKLAEVLKGMFVTRYPPDNAKGPVRTGLRLSDGWFLELAAAPNAP
jgi:hypothetical protein